MKMQAMQDIVNLLDRKFDYMTKSQPKDFMLDLANFVNFLTEHDLMKDFTLKIYRKFIEEYNKYEDAQRLEKKKIIKLANKIKRKYRELDDSKMKYPGAGNVHLSYDFSFANFNDIANNREKTKSIPLDQDMLEDLSAPARMLRIIECKLDQYASEKRNNDQKFELDQKISLEFTNLKAERKFRFKNWLNSCRVSAGSGLHELIRITSKINPQPKEYSSLRELRKQLHSFEAITSEMFDQWIIDVAYGQISSYVDYKPGKLSREQILSKIKELKYLARRVYEAVREEIGTSLLHSQLMDKYKARSMWYNFSELELLAKKNKRNREKTFTLDLAKYLFDCGLPVLYRMKLGRHELDMVDPEANNPLVIEVKVYSKPSKKKIIAGIWQLHSYLNNLSAKRHVAEAFYVMYRFGGPLYELPQTISTNQFVIHPVLIDLGASAESGSRQKISVVLSMSEILHGIKRKGKTSQKRLI
jgi:hypothetical protein